MEELCEAVLSYTCTFAITCSFMIHSHSHLAFLVRLALCRKQCILQKRGQFPPWKDREWEVGERGKQGPDCFCHSLSDCYDFSDHLFEQKVGWKVT